MGQVGHCGALTVDGGVGRVLVAKLKISRIVQTWKMQTANSIKLPCGSVEENYCFHLVYYDRSSGQSPASSLALTQAPAPAIIFVQ